MVSILNSFPEGVTMFIALALGFCCLGRWVRKKRNISLFFPIFFVWLLVTRHCDFYRKKLREKSGAITINLASLFFENWGEKRNNSLNERGCIPLSSSKSIFSLFFFFLFVRRSNAGSHFTAASFVQTHKKGLIPYLFFCVCGWASLYSLDD